MSDLSRKNFTNMVLPTTSLFRSQTGKGSYYDSCFHLLTFSSQKRPRQCLIRHNGHLLCVRYTAPQRKLIFRHVVQRACTRRCLPTLLLFHIGDRSFPDGNACPQTAVADHRRQRWTFLRASEHLSRNCLCRVWIT